MLNARGDWAAVSIFVPFLVTAVVFVQLLLAWRARWVRLGQCPDEIILVTRVLGRVVLQRDLS